MSLTDQKRRQAARIIAILEKHFQRATYGAVADYVGLPALSLMSGEPKNERNAWVVAKKTGKPTGYSKNLLPVSLEANPMIIGTAADLGKWLQEKGGLAP